MSDFREFLPCVSLHSTIGAMMVLEREEKERGKQNLHPWVKVDKAVRPLPPKKLSNLVGLV